MRRKRWVVYGVDFGFGKTKPERLDIISWFRTRREAVECVQTGITNILTSLCM
jgi:hypothetical protein